MSVLEHAVEISFLILNRLQIRTTQHKLNKSVVKQVVSPRRIVSGQLHSPAVQPAIALDEEILVTRGRGNRPAPEHASAYYDALSQRDLTLDSQAFCLASGYGSEDGSDI